MNYHYADSENQVIGPITDDELHALYRSGTITEDTNIFPEGDTDWRPYRSIAPLPAPPSRSLVPLTALSRIQQVYETSTPVAAATQKCPFCAEDISVSAKKCKHCGEILDVALRAAEEAKRANATPMVFMNAGGAASSAAASNSRPSVVVIGNRKSGLVAAFLNLLIPGLGYMYCGRILLGCFVLVLTVALVTATAGIAAVFLYPIFIIDGFLAAGRANRQMVVVT